MPSKSHETIPFKKVIALGEVFFLQEMPEYRNAGENCSPASLVFPLVCRDSPASAFRHRRQSGTAGHGLVR
jgi:hypothetical protein